LEARVPFLDHRIVEFANKLPFSMKINHNGVQKYILKSLLKDLAPDKIVSRGKQGFGLPLKHWLRDKYKDYAYDLLTSSSSISSQYLNAGYINNLLDSHQKGKRDFSDRIWSILWFEEWCRANKI
ncbi:MAG: asparagine synthase C-terminal domain-containing protein, partial [Flavobacteriaceae bacterium]|nr:asparagine synthase C-terminal domain-containing protein [Flavobacteriaceae bacterium]